MLACSKLFSSAHIASEGWVIVSLWFAAEVLAIMSWGYDFAMATSVGIGATNSFMKNNTPVGRSGCVALGTRPHSRLLHILAAFSKPLSVNKLEFR